MHSNSNRSPATSYFAMRSRTEIKYEVEETITLKLGEEVISRYCPKCLAIVPMAAPEVIARRFAMTEREVFRLIEVDAVHFAEGERTLVCLASFPAGSNGG